MTGAELNKSCELVRLKHVSECWLCKCGKHHVTLEGAELCCTKQEGTSSCDCRHCDGVREWKKSQRLMTIIEVR